MSGADANFVSVWDPGYVDYLKGVKLLEFDRGQLYPNHLAFWF